ncbi:MAG: hypothetical protein M3Z33_13240 [Actinomycetota bacterium]|nr:hypothetical protein [Actinomycetota bacterium]
MADECKCGCNAHPVDEADVRTKTGRQEGPEPERRIEELERRVEELERSAA